MIKNILFAFSCLLISSSVFADLIKHKTCAVYADKYFTEALGKTTSKILIEKGYRVIMAPSRSDVHVGHISFDLEDGGLTIFETQMDSINAEDSDDRATAYYLTAKSLPENIDELGETEQRSVLRALIPPCTQHNESFAVYLANENPVNDGPSHRCDNCQ